MSEHKSWELRILHIRDEIENIRRFAGYMSKEQLSQDTKTLYALVRSFQIIGEAAKKVPDDIRQQYPKVPWRRMTGLRDVLVHDYADIDIETIYNVIAKELSDLENEILKIPVRKDI